MKYDCCSAQIFSLQKAGYQARLNSEACYDIPK